MSNRKEVKEQSTRRTTDLSSRSPEKPVVGKDFAELKRKKQRQKIEISESAFKKKGRNPEEEKLREGIKKEGSYQTIIVQSSEKIS